MNKTISIHLQGTPFQIEEGAYEILRNYLDRLTKVIQNEKGSDEILQDVELRMAELFTKQITPSKKVIETPMVEEVISILGNPEVFGDNDANENRVEEKVKSVDQPIEKRLFRDEENSIVGGVCSGFANYMNWDVTIIRAIYVGLIIFGGFGIPLYIILWIITPKAKTSIEKLQMKGKPVTLESMKSEIEEAADRIQSKSKDWSKKIKEEGTLQNSVKKIIRVFSVGLGLMFLVMGISLFVTAIVFIFGDPNFIPAQVNGEFMSFGTFGELILESDTDLSYFFWGVVLTSISIIGLLWLTGLRLILTFKSVIIRYTSISLSVCLVLGIILLSLTGAKTGRAFAVNGEVERDLYCISSDTLNMNFENLVAKDKDGFKTVSRGDDGFLKVVNNRIYLHGIEVEYKKSLDTSFHIKQLYLANGRDHQSSLTKAKHIDFKTRLEENQFYANTHYTFPASDKLRDQKVKIIIEVPTKGLVQMNGKTVYPFLESDESKQVEENAHGYVNRNGDYDTW